MSYKNKNNLPDQIRFLDKFLPLVGISGISDVETEIDSRSLNGIDISSYRDEIRQLFKVSGIKLDCQTGQQIIALLKHLCRQARVLFDVTRYSNRRTFALAPDNVYLASYRRVPPVNTVRTSAVKVNCSEEKILDYPKIDLCTPFSVLPMSVRSFLSDELLQEYSRSSNQVGDVLVKVVQEGEDVRYKYEDGGLIEYAVLNDNGTVSTFIHLPRTNDILNSVNSLRLFDQNREEMKMLECHITSYLGLTKFITNYTVGTDLNLFLVSNPFLPFYIEVVTDRTKPIPFLWVGHCIATILNTPHRSESMNVPERFFDTGITPCLNLFVKKEHFELPQRHISSICSNNELELFFNAKNITKNMKNFSEDNPLIPAGFISRWLSSTIPYHVEVKFSWLRNGPKTEMFIDGTKYTQYGGLLQCGNDLVPTAMLNPPDITKIVF